ncbi:MAG: YfcE family phosphodiesterase [Spirochaetota bacterium]
MKKILVLSDSHGNTVNLKACIRAEEPFDAVIFCGDGLKDFAFVGFSGSPRRLFVPGNCDGDHPVHDADIVFEELFGRRVLVFHGHRHNVKHGEQNAAVLCRSMSADVCVFGHTHEQYLDNKGSMLILNPGSAAQGDYAVINAESHGWDVQFKTIGR